MGKALKIGLLALGGGVLYTAFRGFSLKKSSDRLQIYIKRLPYDIDNSFAKGRLRFKVDLIAENPGNDQFRVMIKTIRLFYLDKMIGSQAPNTVIYTIRPVSKGLIKGIQFEIPYLSLIQSGVAQAALTNITQISQVLNKLTYYINAEVNGIEMEIKASI